MSSIRVVSFLALVAAVACQTPVRADIYKWTSPDGKTHFGDRPPLDSTAQQVNVRVNTYGAPPEVEALAPSSAKAATATADVVVYTTQRCGYCRQAKQYLSANRIPFTEYDVETSARGRKDYRDLQGRGVPIILVGDRRMNGFSAGQLDGMLRGAGYRF